MGPDGALVPAEVTVMGPISISAEQLAAWFAAYSPGGWLLTVSPLDLCKMFVQEGFAEGVRGDLGFCQSIVETGWFRYGGSVLWTQNNFAGIGATDTNPHPATFPDARTGVRAQVQHLRRYADATCTSPSVLHYPLVDPRFSLVTPGRCPLMNTFGAGCWASSLDRYGERVLGFFASALAWRDAHP